MLESSGISPKLLAKSSDGSAEPSSAMSSSPLIAAASSSSSEVTALPAGRCSPPPAALLLLAPPAALSGRPRSAAAAPVNDADVASVLALSIAAAIAASSEASRDRACTGGADDKHEMMRCGEARDAHTHTHTSLDEAATGTRGHLQPSPLAPAPLGVRHGCSGLCCRCCRLCLLWL